MVMMVIMVTFDSLRAMNLSTASCVTVRQPNTEACFIIAVGSPLPHISLEVGEEETGSVQSGVIADNTGTR
jgi:hypothetical protein